MTCIGNTAEVKSFSYVVDIMLNQICGIWHNLVGLGMTWWDLV